MPTYSYECRKCGHVFDVFHAMSATPKVHCEECNSSRMERLIGIGSGIIFKGSGFYETDFKEKKGKPPSKSDGKSKAKKADAAPKKTAAKSSESKAATTAKSN
jgi:putative FmdB family regulatory protein